MTLEMIAVSFLIGVASSFFVAMCNPFIEPFFSITLRYKDVRGIWVGTSIVEGQEHTEILTLEKQFFNRFWGKFESENRVDDHGDNIIYRFSGRFLNDQSGMIEFKTEKPHLDSPGVSFFKVDRYNNKFVGASVTGSKDKDSPILVSFEYIHKENIN